MSVSNWFDNLTSSNAIADRSPTANDPLKHCLTISDVDWDTKDGHYRVRLHGEWIDVPDIAVVTGPNRYGPAVVWPYMDENGKTYIRCFLPGAGA